MKNLIKKLNEARESYYNKDTEVMSNFDYDKLYDELIELEKQTGIILSNSPTQTVGYEIKSKLEKSNHITPLLSLDKTKEVSNLERFRDGKDCLIMYKLDGLTIELNYENGELVLAKTRGDGTTGEVVTHNAKVFSNVPLAIPYLKPLRISGEAFITYETFEKINSSRVGEDKYKNTRNLASGSVRQLNSEICAEKEVTFYPFNVLEGFENTDSKHLCFEILEKLGFGRCPYYCVDKNDTNLQEIINYINENENNIPIDGLVLTYNSRSYSESLGHTSHHMRSGIAFKWSDSSEDTILKNIELDIGKSGQLSYTAVFNPVDIDGATISRATLHNYDRIKELQLGIGDEIQIIRANSVIPQVVSNNTQSGTFNKALFCPICGSTLIHKGVHQFCVNNDCPRQVVARLTHWCSRDAMNIDGVSEKTICKIRDGRITLNSVDDLYTLCDVKDQLEALEGFGKSKVDKLLSEIEKSKSRPLSNVLYGLSMPSVGRTASKKLAEHFGHIEELMIGNYNKEELQNVIGVSIGESLWKNLITNEAMCSITEGLFSLGLTMTQPVKEENDSSEQPLEGLTFVVTGKVEKFTNRKELQSFIESKGGKVSGSVSKNTTYLLNNDVSSTTGKNKKAKELGVSIICEAQLIMLIYSAE